MCLCVTGRRTWGWHPFTLSFPGSVTPEGACLSCPHLERMGIPRAHPSPGRPWRNPCCCSILPCACLLTCVCVCVYLLLCCETVTSPSPSERPWRPLLCNVQCVTAFKTRYLFILLQRPRSPQGDLQRFYFFGLRSRENRRDPAQPSPAAVALACICLSGCVYTDEYKFPLLWAFCILFLVPPLTTSSPLGKKKTATSSFSGTIIFFN